MTQPSLHIAFGVDRDYLVPMAACMASIRAANPSLGLAFHVMADLTGDDRRKLADMAKEKYFSIEFLEIDKEKLKTLPPPGVVPYAAYNRFFICDQLVGKIDRLLYIDADVICLGEIHSLLDFDLKGMCLAGVPDVNQKRQKESIFLEEGSTYINTGFLFIDLKKWAALHVSETCYKILADKNAHLIMPDQDVINLVLEKNILVVGSEWNLLAHAYPVTKETRLLHYAGSKPWQLWSKLYGDSHFTSALALTPWADWTYVPKSRKHRNKYAQALLAKGMILRGIYWYARFVFTK